MLKTWIPGTIDFRDYGLDDTQWTNNGLTINNSGKLGKCIYGSGSNLFTASNYSLSEKWSYALWWKDGNLENGWQYVFLLHNGKANDINGQMGFLSLPKEKRCEVNSNGTWHSTVKYTPGDWNHIAATYDGTTCKIYLNGNYYASFTPGKIVTGTNMSICRSYVGYINDLRIYDNEVLSPREIKEISKGLVLHYPLAMPGGENLLKNGSLSTDFSNWSRNDASNMEIIEKDGCPAMHVSFSELKITRWITQNIISYIDTSNLDQIYTVSADVLAENITNGTTNPMMSPCYFSGSYDNNGTSKWLGATYLDGAPHSYCYGIAGKGWCHFVTRIKFAQVPTTMNFYCYFRDFTGDVWIRNLKFEIGDKDTSWTPNPADPEYSAMGYDEPIEYDVSGYGNNGTKVGNITYNTDSPRYETSAYFNGSSDIRSAKSSFGWFDFNEGTVAAWYKPANTTQTWASVGVQNDGGAGSRSFSVCNYSGKAGTVVGYDSSWGYLASNCSMDANVWYHLCATITNGDTVKLYVNGELVQTRTVTNTTGTIASTTQFAVGVDLPGSDERYTGQLSDVRFYATCLSADDIKALYQIPISLSSDGTLFASEYVEG